MADAANEVINSLTKAAQCFKCNGVLRQPISLPCLHSYCRQCVDDILHFNDDGSATIACPETECQKIFVIKAEDTSEVFPSPKHFLCMIQSLMSFHKTSEQQSCQQDGKKCNNVIDRFCASCETKICNSCSEQHRCDRSACTLITFDKNIQDYLPVCEEHGSLARSICNDCNFKAICIYCENREHKLHQKSSLNEYGAQVKQSFTTLLEEVKSKFSDIRINYKEELEKLHLFRSQVQQELQVRKLEQLNNFYDKLAAAEEKLLKALDLKISDFTEKLNRNNLMEKDQEDAIAMYIDDVQNKTNISIVNERKAIPVRIDDLSSVHCFSANLPAELKDGELLGDLKVKVFKESAAEMATVMDVKMDKIIKEEEKISELYNSFEERVSAIEDDLYAEDSASSYLNITYRDKKIIKEEIVSRYFTNISPGDVQALMDANKVKHFSLLLQYNAAAKDISINMFSNPLHYACGNGLSSFVELLLLHGDDANKEGKNGCTPLIVAARLNRLSCIQILIDHKADVNKVDSSNMTPLMYAARNGNSDCVQILLENNAETDVENTFGWKVHSLAKTMK